MRLLNSIFNILHVLSSQGRDTQSPINQQNKTEDSKAQLQLIHTALKQIHTDSEADRALKNQVDRKRLSIERWTLAAVAFGVVGALVNLWFLNTSINTTKQQLRAMYSITKVQQRAYVNVQDIKLLSFKVGERPEALVSYKNSGLTPANEISIAPDSYLYVSPGVTHPAPPRIKYEYLSCEIQRGGSGPILPPGVTRTVNTLRMIAPMSSGPLELLTDKSVSDMRGMGTTWYVVVYIRYIDSFGDCHRSVEPFEFDPFTQAFTPSLINAIPDQGRPLEDTKSLP